MSEIGYNFAGLNISPIFRFEQLWGGTSSGGTTSVNQTRAGGGLAFWPYGHNSNLKAFYMHDAVSREPARGQSGQRPVAALLPLRRLERRTHGG